MKSAFPIIDAEFEVIEPGDRAEPEARVGPHPLTVTVCYGISAVFWISVATWAKPYAFALMDRWF